jgi:O-antigen ligase
VTLNPKSFLYGMVLTGFVVFIEPAPYELLALGFVGLTFLMLLRRGRVLRSHALLLGGYLTLMLLTTLGNLFSPTPLASLGYHAVTMLLAATAVAVPLNNLTPDEEYRYVYNPYVYACLLNGLVVLLGLAGLSIGQGYHTGLRPMGYFKDPNVMSAFCGPGIVLSIDYLIHRRFQLRSRWIHGLNIALSSLCLVAALSRAAYVQFVLTLLVYLVGSGQLRMLVKLSAYALGLLVVLVLGVVYLVGVDNLLFLLSGNEFYSVFSERFEYKSYDDDRFGAQQKVLKSLTLFGSGGYSADMLAGYSTHSLYVRALYEFGYFGGALFLLSLYTLFAGLLLRLLTRRSPALALVTGALAGVLVSSFVIDTVHWRHFWLFIGLGLNQLGRVPSIRGAFSRVSPVVS